MKPALVLVLIEQSLEVNSVQRTCYEEIRSHSSTIDISHPQTTWQRIGWCSPVAADVIPNRCRGITKRVMLMCH